MLRSASLTVVFLLACGDDTAAPDAARDSGLPDTTIAMDSGSLVSPVAEPALPDFSGCPDGWRAIAHAALEGLTVCEPWPESGAADCAPHEAHFPGGAGCERIGSPCPGDGWPAGLPGSGVVYVWAGAPAGGDGTRETPFVTIQEGVDAAAEGETVAIALGLYDGRVQVTRPVHLVGACPEGVVLARSAGVSGTGIVSVTGASPSSIRDVQLRSDRDHNLLVLDSDVTVRGVAFDGAGVIQNGGETTFDEVGMRGFGDITFAALNITGSARVELTRVAVVGTEATGITVTAADTIRLSDVAVRDVRSTAVQLGGDDVAVARLVVEDAVEGGLLIDGTGLAEDVVVRRVSRADSVAVGFFSPGLQTMRRVRVESVDDLGLSLGYAGGTMSDILVVGPAMLTGLAQGRGIELAGGASVIADRVAVLDTADLAILLDGVGTDASFTDLVIDEVATAREGNFGRCLHVQVDALSSVSRARLGRCREVAVTASHGGSVTLRDVRIEHTLPVPCELGCESPRAGIGIVALEGGGRVDAERFVVSDSALAGVQIVAGGEVDLRDGTIEMNPVGVNVQVEGYDLSRVMRQIVFRDNGVNLDSTDLPVPAAMTSTSTP